MKRANSRLIFTLLALVGVVGAAMADIIPPLTTQHVGPAKIVSPRRFIPRIKHPMFWHREHENPMVWNKKGQPNSLKAGSGWNSSTAAVRSIKFPAEQFDGYVPPDCDFAVGPSHIVATANTTIGIYDKSGAQLFEQSLQAFFSGVATTDFLADPKDFYDPVSDRYFVVTLEVDFTNSKSGYLIGVSATNDPTGNWYKYRVSTLTTIGGTAMWLDYPGFSCNKDSVVVTGNMFPFSGAGFGGVQFFVMPKAQLLAGQAFTATQFLDSDDSTAQAARSVEANNNQLYFVSTYDTATLKLHALTGLPNTPTLTSTKLKVPNFEWPQYVPGPSGHDLDSLDGRIFTAVTRDGNIWATHNVLANASDNTIGARWYEIKANNWPNGTDGPALVQSGTLMGAAGESYHMPAINVNKYGAVSLIFSRTGPTTQADLMLATRTKTSADGTFGVPQMLATSAAETYFTGVNRWGDYFHIAIDPTDDATFWGIGEVIRSDGWWSEEVNTWKVVSAADATAFMPQGAAAYQGTKISGDDASLTSDDGIQFRVQSTGVARQGSIAAVTASFATAMDPTKVGYLAIRANATSTWNATQMAYLYNWTTNQYDLIGSRPAQWATDQVFEVKSNLGNYVAADGTVKGMVRTVAPVRGGSLPPSYTLGVDQFVLLGLSG